MSEPASPEIAVVETPPTERPWPKDVPRDPLEVEKLATVNSDGDVISYPATNEPLPEEVRQRRANRPKVPKGYRLRVRRKDGKSEEYWMAVAEAVMDQTGIAPVDPKVFAQETAAKFSMVKGYTTLQIIEMAIEKCEKKLQEKDLTEGLQIEWMNALRGMLAMQKEHLDELKKSAMVASEKSKFDNKPRNLPPIVLQQNFNTKPEELKRVDSPKAISEG